MAKDMVLYWGSGSGPCWSVMIMLEEKQLQGYESHLISFSKMEHKGEDVKKLNPRCQVPAFKHGDIVVNESAAILDYLQAVFGSQGHQLMPTDPAQLAKVVQRRHEVVGLRRNCIEAVVYLMMQGKTKDMPKEELQKLYDAFLEELGRWEGYLKQGDGSYIAGKDFTLADVAIFPFLAFMVRSGLKTEGRFPCLQAYHDLVAARPSVQASWPPHWKESPAKPLLADI